MGSKPLELPEKWKERIEANAKSVSGHQPDEDSTPFRNGMYSGYKSGAMAYAPWLYTCQTNYAALQAKCDRYEAKLTSIKTIANLYKNWDEDSIKQSAFTIRHLIKDVLNLADKALSAGAGENEISGPLTDAEIKVLADYLNQKEDQP